MNLYTKAQNKDMDSLLLDSLLLFIIYDTGLK